MSNEAKTELKGEAADLCGGKRGFLGALVRPLSHFVRASPQCYAANHTADANTQNFAPSQHVPDGGGFTLW